MGDADIPLRHLCRRHAEALARPYLPDDSLEIVAWADTQVTAVERRLDKTLLLRVAGQLRALEVEFEYRYALDLPDRIHEYQGLSRRAFRDERPHERPPPIESVVILLTGRRKPWPVERALRTSWRGRKFSGTRFRLDAVYQRSVAELCARGSPFWLVFTPLARDATVAAMRDVVEKIRAEVPAGDDQGELFFALLAMADVDPWRHSLRKEIETMIQHEPVDWFKVSKTLRDAYERGQREGLEKGIEQGREKGREKGIEQGREQGVQQMLRGLFARRLHRALTAREQEVLAARAALDPGQIQDKILTLEGEALAAWLLAPERGSSRRRGRAPSRTP